MKQHGVARADEPTPTMMNRPCLEREGNDLRTQEEEEGRSTITDLRVDNRPWANIRSWVRIPHLSFGMDRELEGESAVYNDGGSHGGRASQFERCAWALSEQRSKPL